MSLITCQLKLTASTGSQITPLLPSDHEDCYLQSLRLKIQCPSLATAGIPNLEPELTRAERIRVIRDLEWNSPRRELEILQHSGDDEYCTLARVSCLNRPPFYSINLLQFLTDNADYPIAAGAELAFRVKDAGSGLLSGSDELVVYGGGFVDSSTPSASGGSSGDVSLGEGVTSLVEVSTGAILIAPEQPGRRYFAVSVQSGGPVWIGLGSRPSVNTGILLTGTAASYELNNYYGQVYAIAQTRAALSVTLVS